MAEHYCRNCKACDCDCGHDFDPENCQYCKECAGQGWSPDTEASVVFAHRDGIFVNRAGKTTKLLEVSRPMTEPVFVRCEQFFYSFPMSQDRHQCERGVGHVGECGFVCPVDPITTGVERPEGVSVNTFLKTATKDEVRELNKYINRSPMGFPTSRELLREGFQNAIHQVAYDFVRYYIEGTEGCRNCGGFPHSDTCFVFRFEHAITVDYMNRHHPEPASVPTPLQVLRSRVEKDTQKEVARSLDISAQYLCDVVNGRREVSDALADKLGYQRIITFMRKP